MAKQKVDQDTKAEITAYKFVGTLVLGLFALGGLISVLI